MHPPAQCSVDGVAESQTVNMIFVIADNYPSHSQFGVYLLIWLLNGYFVTSYIVQVINRSYYQGLSLIL